jgi:hypothetical protein
MRKSFWDSLCQGYLKVKVTKFPAYRQAGKSQAPNKLQFPMPEISLPFGVCSLIIIWVLVLGYWRLEDELKHSR